MIDPQARLIGLHLYDGLFKVITMHLSTAPPAIKHTDLILLRRGWCTACMQNIIQSQSITAVERKANRPTGNFQ